MPGRKSTLPLLGPALILLIAGIVWWWPRAAGKPAANSQKVESWQSVDFTSLKPGGSIPGWDINQGAFRLVEIQGRTVLELQPEPMGEGKLKWSQLMTGGGAVRARMQGERTRRAVPRFCVALEGGSEVQFRAVPVKEVVEIAVPGIPEKILATAPWEWKSGQPLWLEFKAHPDKSGGTLFEGRAWAEGEPRPDAATLQYQSPAPPGLLRAIVEGAPYALRPIHYDRIEALRSHQEE